MIKTKGVPQKVVREQSYARKARAVAMRQSGMTFREIGEALQVSTGRAQQIVTRAERATSNA